MEVGELEGLHRAHKLSGESGTNERTALFLLRWNRSLEARPLHLISQRPIFGHCLSGTYSLAGTFRDCEKPAKVPTQPARIRLTPATKR